MKKEEQVTFQDIKNSLKKNRILILSIPLVCTLVAAAIAFLVMKPTYQSTVQMLVNQTYELENGTKVSDIETNVQMIATYQDMILGEQLLNKVIDTLKLDTTDETLRSRMEITKSDYSEVFSLTVSADDPQQAATIANETATQFEQMVQETLKLDSFFIVAPAEAPARPASASPLRLVVYSFLLGLVLALGLAFFRDFMDTAIRDKDYLTTTYGWTDLGSISDPDKVKTAKSFIRPPAGKHLKAGVEKANG